MKKKVISMLLAVSMISTSPIYAAEFSDGNSVVVNDADTVNGTDADSAEIPDTTLFSSDTVDGAGDVNDSVDTGEIPRRMLFLTRRFLMWMTDQVVGWMPRRCLDLLMVCMIISLI